MELENDIAHQEDLIGHDLQDLEFLQPRPGDVVQNTPKPLQRLEAFSVICIICNRMIGTGIFVTPTTVIQHTRSVGITILFWLFGAIAAMAGILVYIEFGLTTPRYLFGRRKISVPRNGGELHYLKDIFKRPAFLTTCVFGVAFVLIGTSAMNALSFGIRILEASNIPVTNFAARGIAIAVITLAVIIHGTWRQAGLFLNNVFAVTKVLILVFIVVTGFVSWGGAFKTKAAATENFNIHNAFKNPEKDSYGFAESFLAIIFAYSGFNQANYVLSEIDNPRKKYKWPVLFAVAGVSTLYILVNVAYFIVVPVELQLEGRDVATTFFILTFGSLSSAGDKIAPRILAAFMAISSLGNIIVMTYTAARVKQEIAKEGVLPFRKFIARSINVPSVPFGKLFGRDSKPVLDEIPAGALIIHWIVSVILILATAAQKEVSSSYTILVSLYSYIIDAFFGLLLGLGLLFLRSTSARKWAQKSLASSKLNPVVSTIAALIFTIANAFPIVSAWIPPSNGLTATTGSQIPWYATPTVGWALIVFSLAYWVAFEYIVPLFHSGKKRKLQRKLFFHEEHGYPVQWHEQLHFSWVIPNSDADLDHYEPEEIEVRMKRESGA